MEAGASSETPVNLHVERCYTPAAAFLQSVSLPNHYILHQLCGLPIHVKKEFLFWWFGGGGRGGTGKDTERERQAERERETGRETERDRERNSRV